MNRSERRCAFFGRPDNLSYDVVAGVLRNRCGNRLIAVNDQWLRGFVSALEHETAAAAPGILRRCGEIFGTRLAQRFESEVSQLGGVHLRERTMNEFCVLLDDFWRASGMGQLCIDWEHAERFVSIRLVNSPMQDIGPSGHIGDDLFAGILTGFFEHFADAQVTLMQSGDQRLGDKEGTTFLLGSPKIIEKACKLRQGNLRHREIVKQLSVTHVVA